MAEIRNIVSESQKAAQKKYDQKTKMVSIKYTPLDMNEYQRLKNYLNRTGQSTNGFIKKLINDFFESGQDKNNTQNRPKKKNGIWEKSIIRVLGLTLKVYSSFMISLVRKQWTKLLRNI